LRESDVAGFFFSRDGGEVEAVLTRRRVISFVALAFGYVRGIEPHAQSGVVNQPSLELHEHGARAPAVPPALQLAIPRLEVRDIP
jgi:hypothetical protein